MNSTTAWHVLLRLCANNMTTTKSSNIRTVITVVNWKKYQGDIKQAQQPEDYATTHVQQRDNTIIRIKNKEKEYIHVEVHANIRRVYDLFIQKFEKNPNQYRLTTKRQQKLRIRLKDAGLDMLEKAITNVAETPFYRGENDRGWVADLDFIIRSYEQVERLANMDGANAGMTVEEALQQYA